MTTIYDQRYIKLIAHLETIRKQAKMSQTTLAAKLGLEQSIISKVESFDRRIDIIELHDWLTAIDYSHKKFLQDVGWMEEAINTSLPAVPIPGKAAQTTNAAGKTGTTIEMVWQGQKREVIGVL